MATNPLPDHRHPDGSREMAPHVWQHPERLSGAPAVTGHRIDVAVIHRCWESGIGWPVIREHYDVTEQEYVAAVAFEAGVLWEMERRKENKRARLARRWQRGRKAAQEGASDGGE